jgi:hypothetical protein
MKERNKVEGSIVMIQIPGAGHPDQKITGKLRQAFLFLVSKLIAIFLITFAVKKTPLQFP